MAVVCGIAWGVVGGLLPFVFFNLLLGPAVGYTIGEVVGLSVNRKRGKGLATVAGIGVVISFLVSIFIPWGYPFFGLFNIVFDLVAMALGIFVAVTRLR